MKIAVFAALTAAVASAAKYPTFAPDWSSYVEQNLVVMQGGGVAQGDYYCCGAEAPDCEVQVQFQASNVYFAFSKNITASWFPDGTRIVSSFLYQAHKEYSVDRNGTCKEYCPIDGRMEPYNVFNTTDIGSVNINGQALEGYQSVDVIPGLNITMEIDTQYVDQTNFTNAIPVLEVDQLTPFGEPIGESNTTYAEFSVGTPNASYIALPWNADTCPLAKKCNQAMDRQMHRRATGQKEFFWLSYLRAKQERAAERRGVKAEL